MVAIEIKKLKKKKQGNILVENVFFRDQLKVINLLGASFCILWTM